MKTIYVLWQESDTRRWRVVGRLDSLNNEFIFRYTKGAEPARGFIPFGRMSNLDQEYRSRELFPLFANRLLAEGRPERDAFIEWLDIDDASLDPIELLARSGGIRATDQLQLYPMPAITSDGKYILNFFAHGLRHADPRSVERISSLKVGNQLLPMLDIFNPADNQAIALRFEDPVQLLGYVPRVFLSDLRMCLHVVPRERIRLTVKKVNADAPLQFRLLCSFESDWPENFRPCESEEFQVRNADARQAGSVPNYAA